jgi:uncharacterized protein
MNGEPAGENELTTTPEKSLGPCWRCGKAVDLDQPRCPYCAAALSRRTGGGEKPASRSPDAVALTRMLVVFGGLLAISVVFGLVFRGIGSSARERDDFIKKDALRLLVIQEVVGTVFVLAALAWVPVRFRHPSRTFVCRAAVWVVFVLVLAGLLALNVRYHKYIRDLTDVVPVEKELLRDGGPIPAWFLVICVWPAVFEELFFRYLALGVLRSVVNVHAAVWISSVMFGLAHIGAPLSIPVLTLVGVGLGYARVASGRMPLPMFLHFLHNAAVLSIDLGWIAVP